MLIKLLIIVNYMLVKIPYLLEKNVAALINPNTSKLMESKIKHTPGVRR